jgi:precorrin-6B methylase 2
MPILPRLVSIYETQGFDLTTGLNPSHAHGEKTAPFTYLLKDGAFVTSAGGIAVQELYFLESLAVSFQPSSILIIGNSFGWSAVAMALAFPKAKVLAVDACEDRFTQEGLALTNEIARVEGLSNLLAVKGRSPDDLPSIAAAHAQETPWDMVFIDGEHVPRQVVLDFNAVKPFAATEALWLFHDAVSYDLLEAVETLGRENGLIHQPLWRTPSGIAALVPQSLVGAVAMVLHAFAGSENTFRLMQELGRYGASLQNKT